MFFFLSRKIIILIITVIITILILICSVQVSVIGLHRKSLRPFVWFSTDFPISVIKLVSRWNVHRDWSPYLKNYTTVIYTFSFILKYLSVNNRCKRRFEHNSKNKNNMFTLKCITLLYYTYNLYIRFVIGFYCNTTIILI